jgi:hypothetical protein
MSDFGFIITRHVNSHLTNKYWNHCIKLLRRNYPLKKIVVIDDNSNYTFIKADFEYTNVEIIQSEFPGRGELLPFIYYLRHKWFENAIIIHDSTFLHKRIPFETLRSPVLPLWHAEYDSENITNLLRITSHLNNNIMIRHKLLENNSNLLGISRLKKVTICFGCQCYINHNFLIKIEQKYKISNLVHAIHNRTDRQGLERILGILFMNESNNLISIKSLFGNIFTHYRAFTYNYSQYMSDLANRKIYEIVTKVWSGR